MILESDIVFEESIIDGLLEDDRETLALVDKFESWMDGTCMELNDEDCIIDFIPGKHLKFSEKENYYKTVNIYKFSSNFSSNTYVPFLSAYEKAMGENEYYESVIKLIAMLETKELRAKRLNGQLWYEIDNIQDLNIAESLFAESKKEKYNKIACRYGGYWRYPKLLDFCYLVNPYYPPEKMCEEMKSNFETLFTEYPSGMNVNSLLAAGMFGIDQSNIIVGNGAAELIKVLMDYILHNIRGKLGCIYPTFEEYPNRFDKSKIIAFKSCREDFKYSIEDLMDFYDDKGISAIILINPDNPSGNYIKYSDLIRFIKWGKERDLYIIIDESFVDFADIEDGADINELSLIKEEILDTSDKLFIIKSISKSYGIPGARLGVMASSNVKIIEKMKKNVAIWNINSFGEFFLQIREKYDKDYNTALLKGRSVRKKFIQDLRRIKYLTAYDSQANFVMCKVDGINVENLCCDLLEKNIFIKNLTKKIGNGKQYIRLAVRKEEDNNLLISILKKYE